MKTLPRHCRLHLLFYHRLPMPPAFITSEAPPQIGSYILTRVCLFVCLLPRMLVWVAYHEIWGIGINKGPEKTWLNSVSLWPGLELESAHLLLAGNDTVAEVCALSSALLFLKLIYRQLWAQEQFSISTARCTYHQNESRLLQRFFSYACPRRQVVLYSSIYRTTWRRPVRTKDCSGICHFFLTANSRVDSQRDVKQMQFHSANLAVNGSSLSSSFLLFHTGYPKIT